MFFYASLFDMKSLKKILKFEELFFFFFFFFQQSSECNLQFWKHKPHQIPKENESRTNFGIGVKQHEVTG